MEIIQLLEVLKPAAHAITIKVDASKDLVDIITNTLVAFAPVIVAVVTLYISAGQFKKTINLQAQQFHTGVEQQIKSNELNARLATEAEIKKEICRDVRQSIVDFLSACADLYVASINLKMTSETVEAKRDEDWMLKHQKNAEKQNSLFYQAHKEQIKLSTYVDATEDNEFLKMINDIISLSRSGDSEKGGELAALRITCVFKCRDFIDGKIEEIKEIYNNNRIAVQ
ncbi:hypothetical protein [Enterobacter mori]|uniref:hypothetical protein n=1 Tax=Enterobacter mori TaxID=539813 RepID=UPI0011DD952A|nr:hypothetical protein [Enterobacter mori]